MYQQAIKMAQQYTRPVVVSFRREDNTTGSSIGTFMVLNEEGWILTASHIVNNMRSLEKEKKLYDEYQKKLQPITADQNLTRAQQKKAMRGLRKSLEKNPVTHYSMWWGQDGVTVAELAGNPLIDVATGQMRGFDTSSIKAYPKFKNPNVNFDVGEGLCKLGFPFYEIHPTYDEANHRFEFPPNAVPIPLFPLEGIFTRVVIISPKGENASAKFVETSSPGLRGQSGGPIFDTKGRVWAMQSRTLHYPLGFSPKVPNRPGKEHQFLNTGLGSHAGEIIDFLLEKGVSIQISKD